jgi:hypothetical protein
MSQKKLRSNGIYNLLNLIMITSQIKFITATSGINKNDFHVYHQHFVIQFFFSYVSFFSTYCLDLLFDWFKNH